MVKFYSTQYTFRHPFEDVSYAFLRKYPNPLSQHVLGCDIISRNLDQETGTLTSQRLIQKTSSKNKIAEKLLGKGQSYGFVLEDSVINMKERKMVTVSRNLTYAKILFIEETCTYTASKENSEWTDMKTEARVVCPLWGWSRPVEGVGLEKFKQNVIKARESLEFVIQKVIQSEKLLSKSVHAHSFASQNSK